MASPNWAAATERYRLHLELHGRSQHTVRGQASVLRCFGRFCNGGNPLQPTPALLAHYVSHLRGLYSPYTVRDYLMTLRTFYRWAEIEIDLPVPHCHERPRKPYTHSELRRLLRYADVRLTAILLLFIATGMRAGELAAVTLESIDWCEGTIFIPHGKGDKPRYVVPGQAALEALRVHVRESGVRRGRLFPVRADVLYHQIARLGEKAHVEKANCHRFRNTYADDFLSLGGGVGNLMVALGHSSVAMSLRYARYNEASRSLDAMRRFNPADSLLNKSVDFFRKAAGS